MAGNPTDGDCDDPATIEELEVELEQSQADAVDEMIEDSCWLDDLPEFVGHQDTAAERRGALIAADQQEDA